MSETIGVKVNELLQRNSDDEHIDACLETIAQADEVRYKTCIVIPLKEAFDIYSVRAQINNWRGGKTKGYETLIPALASADVSNVRIQLIELFAKFFVIFTDETIAQLFGVLDCPKKESAWFNFNEVMNKKD